MKEQFTQGDWEAKDWSSHGDWGVECGESSICCAFGASKKNEANAHLIAAAPKMYKMLENAMCLLAENDKECKALSKEIRSLRAEARGENNEQNKR